MLSYHRFTSSVSSVRRAAGTLGRVVSVNTFGSQWISAEALAPAAIPSGLSTKFQVTSLQSHG